MAGFSVIQVFLGLQNLEAQNPDQSFGSIVYDGNRAFGPVRIWCWRLSFGVA